MGNFTRKQRWGVYMTFVLTVLSQWVYAQSGSFGSTFAHTEAETAIYEQHDFVTGSGTINAGIIGSERQPIIGVYSFINPNGTWINASNTAFVDGYVRTYQSGAFTFPIGDNNKYRPAAVSASSAVAPTTAAYFGVDPGLATTSNLMGGNYGVLPGSGPTFPTTSKDNNVGTVDNVEYWDIDGTTPARITLTWDAATPITAMVGTDLTKLRIVGWDGTKWVVIPSTVDAGSLLQNTSASTFTGPAGTVSAGSITTTGTVVPGSYTVYTLAGVCTVTQVITDATSLTTCSGDNVAINYTTVSPGGQVQWTRMPGNLAGIGNIIDFPTATGATPVSYTYTATSAEAYGCTSNTVTTSVTVNPRPEITPSVCSQTICSGQSGDISFIPSVPGSTIYWTRTPTAPAPASGTGNIGQTLINTGPTSVTYTYQVWAVSPGPASCPSSLTITCEIIVTPGLEVLASVATGGGCIGQPLSLSASAPANAQTPFSFAWTGPNGFNATGPNPLVAAMAALTDNGSYTVTITDAAGCSGTATVPVSVSNCCSLTATAGNTMIACAGTDLNLSVTAGNSTTAPVVGPLTYSWTGPNGFVASTANPTISPVTAADSGIYSVTVTDGQGCTATSSVSVTVTNAPSAGEDKTLSICNNETVDLATVFPAGGSFSALNGTLTGTVFDGIASGAGSYTIAYTTGGNGCPIDQAIVTIIVRDCTPLACNFPISAGKVDATCGNSDGTADVTMGGLPTGATVAFAWSNGKTGPKITGLAAGVYSVTATNSSANGVCTQVTQVQVNDMESPDAEISLITAADCLGANGAVAINIKEGDGPFLITWTGVSSGSSPNANLGVTTIPNLAPGNYTFVITSTTSNTSCESYLAVTIPKDDSDQITLTATPTSATACGTFSGSILVTALPAVGVTGPFSFSLNGIAMGTSTTPAYSFTGLKAGVYTVGVSSAAGCTAATIPVTILETGAPAIAGWSGIDPNCPSDQGMLVFAGGQPTATFLIREVTTGAIVGPLTGISGVSSYSLTVPEGTYAISGSSSTSCTSYTTITIAAPEGLNFNVQYTKASCAPGGVANNNGTITVVQITGATGPYSTTVLNAQNQPVVATSTGFYENLAPGIYNVRVTDSRGCFGVESVFVTIPNCTQVCPDIQMITYVVDANCGNSDGRAVAQLGSFTEDDVDYLWSNGFAGKNTSGLSSGIYSVTAVVLTGTFTGCPYINTINVNDIGGPQFEKRTIVASNCAGSTGSVSFSVTSGDGPYVVSWTGPTSGSANLANTDPGFTFTRSGLAAGNYVFTLTSVGSPCKSTQDVTIPVSSTNSISLTATPVLASSCGAQDGSINLTVSPAGTYLISLNGAVYTSANVGSLPILNLPASTYTVSISAANGCTAERTVIVGETGAPVVSGWTSQSATCPTDNGSLIFAGGQSAAVTYRVLLGAGGTVVATVQGDAATTVTVPKGVYLVERKETVGSAICTSFQSFTINAPTGIDFNIQYTPESCGPGGTGNGDGKLEVIQINGGTPNFTVSVTKVTTGAVVTDLQSLAGGDYKVAVVDANGCPGSNDALVTVPPCQVKCPPLAFHKSVIDNKCGSTIGEAKAELLNVPAGATVTYLWSNGQNSQTAMALTSGVYSVTASLFADNTIYAGCMYVDTVNVNDIGGPVVSLSATQAASCTSANGAVALNIQSGTGPFTIAYTGVTTGTQTASSLGLVNITGLKAGNYVFTVTDATTSCKSVIDVVIPTATPNGFLLAIVPTNVSGCGAADGRIRVTVTGGTGPFTYRVNGYIEGVSTTRIFTKGGLPAGVYYVEVSDANGCVVRRENILINETGSTPVAGWTPTNPQCPQNNGTLAFAGTGSSDDEYVVTISGTATEIGRTAGNVAATYSVPGGTYLITKTSSTSCTSATVITISQPNGLDFNIQYTEPTCLSLTAGSLTVIQPAGGTAPYSYTIAGPNGLLVNSATATGLMAGSYTITLGDSRGCTYSNVKVLSSGSSLSVTAAATPAIVCVGSPISLSAIGVGTATPLTYAWSGPDGFTQTGQAVTATATVNGSYTVTVTDAAGCSATAVTQPVSVSVCVPCIKPVLVVSGPVCNTANNTYSVTYTSDVTSVTASAGNLDLATRTISGIMTGTNLVIMASNSCGEVTSATVVAPTSCTSVCAIAVNLSAGQAICVDGTSFVASVTATTGAVITANGVAVTNGVVSGVIGTNVTVVATLTGCGSQTIVIASPASCTAPCVNPQISIAGPVCDGNNLTYSVKYSAPAGVTVSSSSGFVNPVTQTITGITLGTSISVTATNGVCPVQIVPIAAPTNCPPCIKPVLVVSGPVCNTANNTYSVTYTSDVTSVTASAGSIDPLTRTISGITTGTNLVIMASNSCGEVTSATVVAPTSCTSVCAIAVNLSAGQAICVDGTSFVASVTATTGAVITANGVAVTNGVITGVIGTNVTVVATLTGCGSQTIVIASPASCTAPCVNPQISIAGPVCDGNNTTYSVKYTAPAGVTVTSDGGTVNAATQTITGITLGTSISVTATNGVCPVQIVPIAAPTNCPPCIKPVLVVSGPVCNTANNTYSVTYTSDVTSVTASAGNLDLASRTISGIMTGTNLVIMASNSCGEVTSATVVAPTSCTSVCAIAVNLSAGQAICVDGTSFVASVTATTGAVITANGVAVTNGVVSGVIGTNVTVVATLTGCGSQTIVIASPASCTAPCVNPQISIAGPVCDGNNTTYSVKYTAPAGVTVSSSSGFVNPVTQTITGITLGTSISVTATNGVCPVQIVPIAAPTNCPPCIKPVLVVSGPVCNTANNTYSVTYTSDVTSVTANAGNLDVASRTISGITTGTNLVIMASNSCGEVTSATVVAPTSCTSVCAIAVNLSVGQAVCVDGSSFVASVTATTGAVITANGVPITNGVVSGVIGTNVTVVATLTGCGSQTIVIASPASCTAPCVNPQISIAGPVCDGNNTTYSVKYTAPAGVTVTSDGGTVNAATQTITGITLGTSISVTATNGVCPVQIVPIAAPTNCPPCIKPVLVVSGPVCNTANNTYSVTYTSDVTSVTANAGNLDVASRTISGITTGTNLVIMASNSCGEVTSATVVAPTSCTTVNPNCTQLVNLSAGQAICVDGSSFVASVTATTGATITANGVAVTNGVVSGVIGTNVTVVATLTGCGSQTIVIASPSSCTAPCVNPQISIAGPVCDGNNTTYSVKYTAPAGVTVTSDGGTVNAATQTITGITLGTSISVTATNGVCPVQIVPIAAPTNCPPCIKPVLVVSGPVCNTANNTYSVTYTSDVTSVTANAGNLDVASRTISGITTGTNLVIMASNSCGEVTSATVVSPTTCTTLCVQPVNLSAGQAICVDGSSFVASVTATTGAVITANGVAVTNGVVSGVIGTNVTVVATLTGCGSQTIVIASPASCTAPCVNPQISIAGPVCDGNNTTYSVKYTAPAGVTVSSSSGFVNPVTQTITGITLGTSISVTATNGVCPVQIVPIAAPTNCPPCIKPVLVVSGPVCNTANNTYSVTYTSDVTSVTANAGNLDVASRTISGITTGTNLVIMASNSCGEVTSATVVAPTSCTTVNPNCTQLVNLSAGQAICVDGSSFVASVTATTGATITANGVAVTNGVVSGVIGTNVTVVATLTGCGSQTIVIASPASCTAPCVNPQISIAGPVCDGNNTTYSVKYTAPAGVTVSSSSGFVNPVTQTITGITLGTSISVTATNGVCPVQIVPIAAPTNCPPCIKPVLVVSGPVCNTANNTYSVTYTSDVTSVTASAGSIDPLTRTISGITTGTNLVIMASNSCGEVTSATVVAPTSCTVNPNCTQLVNLTAGQAICVDGSSFVASVTATTGAVITANGVPITNGVVSGVIGTNVTVVATLTGCGSQTIVIASPASCTAPCVNPQISIAGPVCDGNNTTYSVKYTAPAGVTVSSSSGFVNPVTQTITGITLGTSISVTATNGVCPVQIVPIAAPTNCPPCIKPVLVVSGPVCNTANNTYSVTYTSDVTSVTASAGSIDPLTRTISGITTGTNLVIMASNSCGEVTSATVVAPTSCTVNPNCTQLVNLTAGQAICVDGSSFVASVTATTGAVITANGVPITNGVVSGVIGTNVTVVATLTGCGSQTIVIASPASCTAPCVNPQISIAGPVCDGNNTTYSVKYTAPAGVTVSSSSGFVNPVTQTITGITLGTSISVTATNGVCPVQIVPIAAPTNCPPCIKPVLVVSGPVCNTANNTYSVTYTSDVTSVTANAGNLDVASRTISGITTGTNLVIMASNSCGEVTSATVVAPTSCTVNPNCTQLVNLTAGQAICVDGSSFVASVTATTGAVITANGVPITNGVVSGVIGTNVTVVATLTGCGSQTIVIASPASCTAPCVNPQISIAGPVCDGNNTTYSVKYTAPAGVTVSSSSGFVNPVTQTITGITLGTSISVTATNGVCPVQIVPIAAPTCPPCSLTATLVAAMQTVCIGSPISLSATVTPAGSYTYVWSGPSFSTTTTLPMVSIANATVANNGVYSVFITSPTGCTALASLPTAVTVTPAPTPANSVVLSICNNETVDLATRFPAGGTFTELTSSSALTGSVFNGIVSQAGTYRVLYSSAVTGCGTATAVATIVVRSCSPPPCNFPISTAVVDANCGANDGRAQALIGGLPSGSSVGYNWSNGASGPQITGLVAGVYSVTATVTNVPGGTYLNGCILVDTINVNDIGGPVVIASGILPATCPSNNNGQVTLNIQSGAAPFNISYTGPVSSSLTAANLGNQTISNLPAGDYVFRITSTVNGETCAGYVPVHIPRDDASRIAVTATPVNATACGSPTGSIQYTVTLQPGVTAPFTYLLNGQVIGTSTSPTYTLNNVVAGAYVISVISGDGCATAQVPVIIEDAGAPPVTGWTAVDAKCPADIASLVFTGGQPATTQYRVTSVVNGGTIATVTGVQSRTLVLSAGPYAIIRTSTADNCTSVDTLIINGPEGLDFNVQYKAATCGPDGAAQADGRIEVVQIEGGVGPYTVRILDSNNQVVTSDNTLVSGNYVIEVRDAQGCAGIQQLLITIPDCQRICPVLPLNTVVVDANCGTSDGTATASLGGLPAGSTVDYNWSNGQNGPTVVGIGAGVYSVTATVSSTQNGSSVGCQYLGMINVNEIGGPIPSVNAVSPSRCSVNTGLVSLSISAGTAPYKVTWTGPNAITGSQAAPNPSTVLISNLAPGSYTFVVTGTGSPCKGVMNVTVPVSTSADITLTATPTNAGTCGASNGSINVTVTGGTPNYNFTLNGVAYATQTSGTLPIPNLPAGYYSIGVTAANGCTTSTSVTIGTNGGQPVTGWSAQSALCPENTGILMFAGGQLATVSYRVLLGGTTPIATVPGNTSTSIAVSRGIYVIERRDNNCVSSYQSFTITAPEGMDFNVQYVGATCAPGGGSNNDGKIQVVQINGGTKPYSVTVLNSDNQVVTNLNALMAGQYTIRVTDANSCTGVSSVLITVPPCPQVCPALSFNKSILDTQCGLTNGTATATLLGVPAGAFVTYNWSNGQNVSSISGLTSGTYSVTATLTSQNGLYNGCKYIDLIHVNDIGAPVANLSLTTGASCTASNGTAVLTIAGGTTPYSVVWTGAASGSKLVPSAGPVLIDGLPAGDYIFTVAGGTSTCRSIVEVTIPHNDTAVMQVTATPADVSGCGASNGSIALNVTGGVAPFLYTVNGYITLSTTSRTPTFPNLPAGSNTVTVVDANGCSVAKVNVLINTQNTTVIAGWSKTDGPCADSNGSLIYAPTPGNAADQYVVRIAGSNTIVGQTAGNVPLTVSLPGGNYLVTRTSSNSCVAVDTLIINQPKGLEMNVQYGQPTCTSLTSGSIAVVQITGGTMAYISTVTSASGVVANLTTLSAGSYTVTTSDAHGCSISQVVSLTTGQCNFCFNPYVYLQGALVNDDGIWPTNPVSSTAVGAVPLMRDDLRALGIIPLTDPYRAVPYISTFYPGGLGSIPALNPFNETITNPAVTLANRGENSVVDWVLVEFRDQTDPSIVRYTRSGLVLRNGTIVDVDGTSCLNISHVQPGDYYIAVRHRNHLGTMTQTTRSLNVNGSFVTVDFRTLTPLEIWHDTSDPNLVNLYGDKERRDISWKPGYYALWGGNANRDNQTIYQGQTNDPLEIYNQITTEPLSNPGNILNIPSYVLNGYYSGDVNMNGKTIFQGQYNDTHIIYNIMIQHPSNIFNTPSFIIVEQLP